MYIPRIVFYKLYAFKTLAINMSDPYFPARMYSFKGDLINHNAKLVRILLG